MSKLDARRDGQGVSGGAAWVSRKAELFQAGSVLGLGFRGGWSAALGSMVVASVCASSLAGPEGASVARGNVNITQNGAETLIRASNNSIINYRSFDIGRGETVRFLQPSADSRVLNRINSAKPTQIDGTLTANGRVYIINPAGVVFGQGSVINTVRLYAAAGKLSDQDFVRGIDRFTDVRGEVRNYGTLSADFIAMVGARVDNAGSISAPQGTVVMTSGSDVMIGEKNGNVFVKLQGQSAQAAARDGANPKGVTNSGTINAAGGKVLVAAGDMYSLALLGGSRIKANDVKVENQGRGEVIVRGEIDASNAAGKGGTVKVLGEKVGLSGATIDASGSTGGGEILVGGNFQGHGPERNATATFVGSDVTLKADATQNGNGGKIIVWSDQVTRFYGTNSAQGGAQGGDGGLVEVSGKHSLDYKGITNTLAPMGKVGTLLLDPLTITVTNGAANSGNTNSTNIIFTDNVGVNNTIANADINAATTNVILQALNTVTIDGAINIANGGTSFSARAGGNILVNASIQTNNGAISLTANDAGGTQSGTGAITIASGATLTSGSAAVTLNAVSVGIGASISAGSLSVTGATTLGAGVTTSGAGGAVFNSAVTVSGNRTINTSAGNGPITFGSTVLGTTTNTDGLTLTAGGGAVSVTGSIGTSILNLGAVSVTSSGSTAFNGANIFASSLSVTGATTLSSNVTTSGAGGVTFNSAVVINGNRTINTSTGNGTIAFGSTISGTTNAADDLTLNAGTTGNITVASDVGSGLVRLGDVTIVNANDATFSGSNAVGTFTQQAGQGTTTFTGALDATDLTTGGNLSFTGNNFTFLNGITSSESSAGNVGGGLTVATSGTLLIRNTPVSIGGAFSVTGAGSADIRTNITVLSAAGPSNGITFANNNVTLGGGNVTFTVNTGGSATRGGAIDITAITGIDLNGTNLTLAANAIELPTALIFSDSLGTTSILTLRGATNATTIDVGVGAGTGTLQLSNPELLAFFDNSNDTLGRVVIGGASQTGLITIGNAVFSDPVTIQAGGAGGTITLAPSAVLGGDNTNAGRPTVTLSATTLNLNGTIITNQGVISLTGAGVITNGASVFVDTTNGGGAAAGANILYTGTINGTAGGGAELISFASGSGGNLTISGNVGSTTPLGFFGVTTANDVSIQGVSSANLSITPSTPGGVITLNGLLETTLAGADSVIINGATINVLGGITTTNAAGTSSVLLTASTLLNVASQIATQGFFVKSGAGAVDLGANIDTSGASTGNQNLVFNTGAYTVRVNAASVTLNAGGGTLFIDNASAGTALNMQGNNLTVRANGLSIANGSVIGTGAGTLSLIGGTDATSIGLVGGSGTFNISQTVLTAIGSGSVATLNIGASGGTETITIGTSTLAVPTNFRANGTGGLITIAGDVTAPTVTFTGAASVSGTRTVDTSAGNGNISFTSTLNGTTASTDLLTLAAGTSGNISVTGAVGGTTTLNAFQVNSANNITLVAVNAGLISLTSTGATGTLNLNGLLSATRTNAQSVILVGNTINVASGITTTQATGDSSVRIAAGAQATISGPISVQGAFLNNGAGAVSLGGDINTSGGASGNRDITFSAGSYAVTLTTANVTLNAGTGTLALSNSNAGTALDVSGRALTIRANGLSFPAANSVIGNGSGSITLLGATDTTTIGVGTGAAGTFVITDSAIAALANEAAGQINIGSATLDADITFLGATFHDPLAATTNANRTIFVTGDILGDQSDAPITLTAAAIRVGANIRTAGAAITLTGNNASFGVVLTGSNVTLDSTNAGAAAGGAAVAINATVNGNTAGAQSLTLDAGNSSASDISISGAIGGTTRIGALTITNGDVVQLQAITATSIEQVASSTATSITTFSGAVNTNGLIGATTNGVSLTGRSFTINGITTTGSGGVAIDASTGGAILLQTTALALDGAFAKTGLGTTTLGVNIFTTDDNISFSGGNTTLSVNARTLAAGTGTITFNNGLALQTNTLTLSADGIDFLGGADSVTGSSSSSALCLFGATGTSTIGIANGAGTLNLSQTDLAAVATTVGELQLGAASGTGLITLQGPPSPVVLNNTTRLRAPASILSTFTVPAASSIFFDATSTVSASLSASSITFTGNATLNGDIALTATNTANTGSLTGIRFGGTVTAGQLSGENLALSGNLLQFNGGANSVAGTGNGGLQLTPVATSDSIGVSGGSGTLQLTQTFFSAVSNGSFNLVTIGATTGTHAIDVAGGSYNTPIRVQTPGTGGTINISSAVTGTGAFEFIADTAAASSTFPITLAAGVSSTNQNVTFTGNTSLTAATATLSAGTGTLTFNNRLNINANALTLSANGIDLLGGAGSVIGTSATSRLCLFGATSATTIGIGSGVGTLNLSGTDIASVDGTVGELQLGDASGTGLITLNSPPTPVAFSTTPRFRAPAAILSAITVPSGACIIFDGDATVSTSLNASCIFFNGNATLNGAITLVATNPSATLGDATGIRFAGGVTTNQATGEDLVLSGNVLGFNGGANSVTGTGDGSLILVPVATSTSIGLAGGAGTLQLSQAFFDAITPGAFGLVTVGTNGGTHAITIAGGNYTVPLLLQSQGSGGTVAITGNVSGTGAGSFRFVADTAAGSGTSPITLGANITTANQSISFDGNVLLAANGLTLNSGTDTVRFERALNINGNDLVVRTNALSLLGGDNSVTGTGAGTLTILGATDATSIGVGSAAGGTLNVSTTTLNALADEAVGLLVFGSATQAADIGVIAPTFRDAVRFQTDINHSVIASGTITGDTSDANITLQGGAIGLGGTITTRGATITLRGPGSGNGTIRLSGGTSTLDTTLSGAASTGATVLLDGTVNGTTAGSQGLTIVAGSAGAASITSDVGGAVALGAIDIGAGGGITLQGLVRTRDSAVRFRDAVTLASNVTVDTTDNGFTGVLGENITFNSTIDADAQANNRVLVLNGGPAGIITLGGNVGGGQALSSLTATGDTQVTSIFLSNVTTTGAQTYNGFVSTGDTLTVLNTGAGITVNGQLQLEDNGIDDVVRFVTAGAAASDLILITGLVDADILTGVPPSLVLDAGSAGAITLSSAAGSGGPILGSLTATGGTISVTNIATSGTQTYNGALSLQGTNSSNGQLNATGTSDIIVNGSITLNHGRDLVAGNLIRVTGTIESASNQFFALLLNAPTINLLGSLGTSNATALGSLSVPNSGALTLGDTAASGTYFIRTQNAFSSAHTITLQQDTQFVSLNGGAIDLIAVDSDSVSPRSLTISTSGATTLNGAIGSSQALQTFSTDTGGTTTLAGNVTTTQSQTFGDNVLLASDLIFNAGNTAAFNGTVESSGAARNATVNASTSVAFNQAVGGNNNKLGVLSVTAPTITLAGVTTTGGQSYTGAATLNSAAYTTDAGNFVITGNGILLNNTTVTANGGSVLVTGNATTGQNSLLSSNGGNVAISGTLTLNGDTVLTTAGNSGSEDVNVGGAINSNTTSFSLSANAGANGDVIFGGDIGLGVGSGQVALSSLTASGATIQLANVRTIGGQSYASTNATTLNGNIQATGTGTVVFSGPLRLSQSGSTSIATQNGSVQFGTVDAANSATASGLNVSVGGSGNQVTFVGIVGGAQALSALTSSGSTLLQGGSVNTTGAQSYGSLTLASSAGSTTNLFASGYTFTGPVSGSGQTLNLDFVSANGIADFQSTLGASGALQRLVVGGNTNNRNFGDTATTRIGGNMTFANGADFRGTSVITNTVTIQGGQGALLFRGRLDADSSGSNRGLTLLSQRDASADFIPFGFGNSIGSTAALGSLTLGQNRASNAAQQTASAVFSDGFDDAGRVNLSSFGNSDSFSINVGSGGFTMGRGEKVTAFGALTINSSGRVRLGDLTSLVSLRVNADTIDLLYRDPSPLVTRTYLANGSNGTPSSDFGLDFVARDTITFRAANTTGAPVVNVVDIDNRGNTGPDLVSFAVNGERPIDAVGVLNRFRFFDLTTSSGIGAAGLTTSQFTDPRSNGSNFLLGLDINAQGTVNAPVASSIAGAIPRDTETRQVATPITVGKALREQLQDLGLNTRELTFEESVEFLVGRSVYRDADLSRRGTDSGSVITVNRLAGPPVQEVVDAYLDLIKVAQTDPTTGEPVLDENGKPVLVSREDTIKFDLGTSWTKYAETTDNPDGLGFRMWLEGLGSKADQNDRDSLEFLNKARLVIEKLDTLGLSTYEIRTPTLNVLSRIQPPEISKIEDMEFAVLGKVLSLK